MLWFILCVAALNMATGFGLGLYLKGYCHGPADAPHYETTPDLTKEHCDLEIEAGLGSAAATDIREEPDPAKDDFPSEDISTELTQPPPDASSDEVSDGDADASFNTSVMAELDAAVALALGDELPANQGDEGSEEAAPEKSDEPTTEGPSLSGEADDGNDTQNKTPVAEKQPEEMLHAFHSQLDRFCVELVDLDERLRREDPIESAELKTRLDSVVESSRKQDASCREAEESLRLMMSSTVLDEKKGEAVVATIHEERREAGEAIKAFQEIDFEGDASSQCQAVLEHAAGWVTLNHDLRDRVSDTISTIHTYRPDDVEDAEIDPLTGLLGRPALDELLTQHWAKDPHRARPVTLAVIDVDHFDKFNRTNGPSVGNRALRAIGRLLGSESPREVHAARFSGQQFALLGIDCDVKQAVSSAERFRQMLESMQMEYRKEDLRLTCSCGIVVGAPSDTQATLYTRAAESLGEAKRYGGNRSFVREGEFPTPVVPPNFILNEKHVTL